MYVIPICILCVLIWCRGVFCVVISFTHAESFSEMTFHDVCNRSSSFPLCLGSYTIRLKYIVARARLNASTHALALGLKRKQRIPWRSCHKWERIPGRREREKDTERERERERRARTHSHTHTHTHTHARTHAHTQSQSGDSSVVRAPSS